MRNTWRHYLRRMASVCIVSGATIWSSAMCYAAQLAYDSAADPIYDNGWQAGDNGGFGFGPWNFDGTYNSVPQQAMDDGLKAGTQTSTLFNDLGRAWAMYNPAGRPVNPPNGEVGTDIARAGRSMPALQVGQTLSVVLDNPTQRSFFRGYNLKLNTGADGNGCFEGDNCSSVAYDPGSVIHAWTMQTFEYASDGRWYWPDETFPLFDTDTDAGVRIEFTLTGPADYSFTMTPLDNAGLAVTRTGALPNADPIDWIEFQFYNTDSDYYPTMVPADARATDYYIRSIEVTGAAPPGVPGDYNNNGKVDAGDYVLWRNGGPLQNEVDLPGTINAADYTAWRARFGNTSGAGSGLLESAVPEPSTFVLFIAGATGVLFLSLRRQLINQ